MRPDFILQSRGSRHSPEEGSDVCAIGGVNIAAVAYIFLLRIRPLIFIDLDVGGRDTLGDSYKMRSVHVPSVVHRVYSQLSNLSYALDLDIDDTATMVRFKIQPVLGNIHTPLVVRYFSSKRFHAGVCGTHIPPVF
jgi:hypothetical protein